MENKNTKILRSLQNAQRVTNFAVKATVGLVFRHRSTFFFKIWFNLRCLFGVINSALVSVIIIIDLGAVFDAILTSSLYENLMSNNFRKTAVLKKISVVN